MRHFASESFWSLFAGLPAEIQRLSRKNYELLKVDPSHPSLHFKTVAQYRSVRVGLRYRALGVEIPEGILWFWIGTHSDYDALVQ